MKTNTAVTLYNKYYESDRQTEVFQRKVITAAEWEDSKYSRAMQSGAKMAEYSAVIFVPFSFRKFSYLKPKAWTALTDKSENWTISEGDLVVKGIVTDELGSEFTPSDLKRKYDDVLTVVEVKTLDMGSYALQHWQIRAK